MQPFVLHTHLYQPERANPWSGSLEPEPSAAPDRDWNERIHRECYRPNATARIFDEHERVEAIVNSYEWLSFDFGPTLLSWLARAHPATYGKVLDADWRSMARTGHGNALAQSFHHTILPLATDRDRRTQIRWGLSDFRQRFGRDAEGMWLPETAANPATIDALIDEGVRFVVLAPHQAARVRRAGGPWERVRGHIDSSRPYRHAHSDGSGRELAVFFYEGALAQRMAFDRDLMDAGRMTDAIASSPGAGGLIHAAVDGETFGHHHRFAELGLAYTLTRLAPARGLEPSNYAAYLDAHPPTDEVEIVGGEGTSWSCAHGVGRWARDCGCATHAEDGWNQAWRAPLRAALDMLRDSAAERFGDLGDELLRDPWRARDAYVEVLGDGASPSAFLARHGARGLPADRHADLWSLLESQRNAMAMYTSCGWFFADPSGIETVYVLRFAARTLDLLDEVGAPGPRKAFVEALGEVRSNRPEVGSAADVWRDQVLPSAVRPSRVGAHLAFSAVVGQPLTDGVETGHDVEVADVRRSAPGRVTLAMVRARITPRSTRRRSDLVLAAVHLGGLDFQGMVAPDAGDAAYEAARDRVFSAFPTMPLGGFLRLLEDSLGGEEHTFEAALPEGRQTLVEAMFGDLTARFHEAYARLYRDHRRTLEMLRAAGYELPRDLRAAAELTLSHELEERVASARQDPSLLRSPTAFVSISELLEHARRQGYSLDAEPVGEALNQAVLATTERACQSPDTAEVERLAAWLALASDLGLHLDLSQAQELAYDLALRASAGRLPPEAVSVSEGLSEQLGLSAHLRAPRPSLT